MEGVISDYMMSQCRQNRKEALQLLESLGLTKTKKSPLISKIPALIKEAKLLKKLYRDKPQKLVDLNNILYVEKLRLTQEQKEIIFLRFVPKSVLKALTKVWRQVQQESRKQKMKITKQWKDNPKKFFVWSLTKGGYTSNKTLKIKDKAKGFVESNCYY